MTLWDDICEPDFYARRAIYDSVKDRLKVSRETFHDALRGCEVTPVMYEGRVIGGIIRKGNELHIGITERPKGAVFRRHLSVLRAVIAEFGYAVTTCTVDCPALGQLKRLGFVEVQRREGMIHLRCEKTYA